MLKEETQSHIKFPGLDLPQSCGAITIEYLKPKLGPARAECLDGLRQPTSCPKWRRTHRFVGRRFEFCPLGFAEFIRSSIQYLLRRGEQIS